MITPSPHPRTPAGVWSTFPRCVPEKLDAAARVAGRCGLRQGATNDDTTNIAGDRLPANDRPGRADVIPHRQTVYGCVVLGHDAARRCDGMDTLGGGRGERVGSYTYRLASPHSGGFPMTCFYIVRDVEPGALCSYKRGRTLLGSGFRDRKPAESTAERWNRFLGCAGVRYAVLEHDDYEPVDGIDHYEN